MDDAFRMRGGKRLRNRPGDLENPIGREASFRNRAVERLPLDELHREEVDTVGFVHGMDSDDVRVVERGDGTCLALKARERVRIAAIPAGRTLSATSRPSFVSVAR